MRVLKSILMWTSLLLLFIVIFYSFLTIIFQPSNDRVWSTDQAILPYAEINGNLVNIHNIRNFSYRTTNDYTPAYYDKTFDLDKIKSVYYVVEPFSGFLGAAHTFLSFEFEENNFVSISVEIRKEKGESFSAFKGILRQYELMYVIADERDVLKLRTNYRKDKVFVYPVNTTKEKMRALFLDMINRANGLKDSPEFYNTITNTCTTNIMRHVNKISPHRIPLSLKVLMPKYSDELAYKLELIDTSLPLEQIRTKYGVNERAEIYDNDPEFSARIRQWDQ